MPGEAGPARQRAPLALGPWRACAPRGRRQDAETGAFLGGASRQTDRQESRLRAATAAAPAPWARRRVCGGGAGGTGTRVSGALPGPPPLPLAPRPRRDRGPRVPSTGAPAGPPRGRGSPLLCWLHTHGQRRHGGDGLRLLVLALLGLDQGGGHRGGQPLQRGPVPACGGGRQLRQGPRDSQCLVAWWGGVCFSFFLFFFFPSNSTNLAAEYFDQSRFTIPVF